MTGTPHHAPDEATTGAAAPHVLENAYYARLSDLERRHWWALGMRVAATRLLDSIAPATRQWRVLDAGCGTGLTLDWVRRYTDRVPVGLDYAPPALHYCAEGGHRRLVQGTATALPLSGPFDLVITADVIQHLPRPDGDRAAVAEAARVLAPGGWLLLRTNSRCGHPEARAADYHRYTVSEVRALFGDAGFEQVFVTYANCVPGLLATLRRFVTATRRGDQDPGLDIIPRPPGASLVTRLMYAALLVEARWIGWRLPLPFGHSILALGRKPTATIR